MALCAYTVRKAVANAIVWLSQDVNKQLALRSPSLIKLLLEALLLDPDHNRQGQSDEVKSAIQRDAAQCFMQLATFGPGREVLQKDTAVLDALRMLVDKGWAEEAKRNAEGALLALDPQSLLTGLDDADQLHIMMSCTRSTLASCTVRIQH
jgi:hypothetical protein